MPRLSESEKATVDATKLVAAALMAVMLVAFLWVVQPGVVVVGVLIALPLWVALN